MQKLCRYCLTVSLALRKKNKNDTGREGNSGPDMLLVSPIVYYYNQRVIWWLITPVNNNKVLHMLNMFF